MYPLLPSRVYTDLDSTHARQGSTYPSMFHFWAIFGLIVLTDSLERRYRVTDRTDQNARVDAQRSSNANRRPHVKHRPNPNRSGIPTDVSKPGRMYICIWAYAAINI